MTNVHQLNVKPKTSCHKYKRHDITVTYIPESKVFRWTFKYTANITFNGSATTASAALALAKVEVDKVLSRG